MKVLLWKMRISTGYSLRKLEGISGISKTTINDIENEKISPTLNELWILSIALNCRVEDLYQY